MKSELQQTINLMELENLSTQKELFTRQLVLLDNIESIYSYKLEHNLYKSTGKEKEEAEEPKSEIQETIYLTDRETNEIEGAYLFERKLRGGFVPEINGYVPEAIVRQLGLEQGDKVFATPKESGDPNRDYYMYSIAKKSEGEKDSNRKQFNLCPVTKEAGRLVVEKSSETDEFIRYKEGLYTVILNDEDVFDLRIKEGDLVDIAFPEENPEKAKVIWKHEVSKLAALGGSISSSANTKKPSKLTGRKSILLEQTLDGQTVLVIGNERMKSIYKDSVEERGGVFLWGNSDYSLERLEPLVRKSNVCVFLLKVSGHIGMEHIKQMCKNYHVPFETTWSNGKSSVVRIAEGGLTQ